MIEVTCQRSSVPAKLRERALAHWYLEELKAVLVGGDASSEEAARAAVAKALAIEPDLRQARWAERLIKLGLYRALQEAYRPPARPHVFARHAEPFALDTRVTLAGLISDCRSEDRCGFGTSDGSARTPSRRSRRR